MKTICFLLATLCFLPLYAQSDTTDPLRFFPHHVGDRWEYGFPNSPEVRIYSIVKDSTDSAGNKYADLRFGSYRIESNGKVYIKSPFYEDTTFGLEYDFTSPRYVVWRRHPGSKFVGQILQKDFTYAYGGKREQWKLVMCELTNINNPKSCLGGHFRIFVEGIGLVQEKNVETDQVELYLRGAVINGDTIGTITGIDDIENVSDEIQIYPNPATDHMIVSLSKSTSPVTITLFDSFGQMTELYQGNYLGLKLYFNLDLLSTGVYFCRIIADKINYIQPITILRS